MTTDSAGQSLESENGGRAALKRAIAIAEGQVQLAEMIGTTQSQVSYWLVKSRKGVSGPFCIRIEQKTGVPRHELRPDIFPSPQISAASS